MKKFLFAHVLNRGPLTMAKQKVFAAIGTFILFIFRNQLNMNFSSLYIVLTVCTFFVTVLVIQLEVFCASSESNISPARDFQDVWESNDAERGR